MNMNKHELFYLVDQSVLVEGKSQRDESYLVQIDSCKWLDEIDLEEMLDRKITRNTEMVGQPNTTKNKYLEKIKQMS